MEPCTSKNVLLLALNVLKYYEKMEQKMSKDTKYYVNVTSDSNVDNFEKLSNGNRIILRSCFPASDVFLLMELFHSVYEHNYWHFENYKCCPNTLDIFNNDERDCTCEKECYSEDLIPADPKQYRQFIESFKETNEWNCKEKYNEHHEFGSIGYTIQSYGYVPMIAFDFCDEFQPKSIDDEDDDDDEEDENYQNVYDIGDIIGLLFKTLNVEYEYFEEDYIEDYKQFWLEDDMWNAKSEWLMYLKGCDGAVCSNTVVDRVVGNEDLQKYITEYL